VHMASFQVPSKRRKQSLFLPGKSRLMVLEKIFFLAML
jgi:hypothetical protein